jgi:branched-chain amino acid transport system substrate-binding protein
MALMLASVAAPGSAAAGKSVINIADIAPLTGSQAQLGKFLSAPCYAATRVINGAGGVLGHPLGCVFVDDTGDAADAVPNVTKALATTANLEAAISIDSNVAATVVPIVNSAKIPMVSSNGLTIYDHTSAYPYFWRMTPADNAGGAAMGVLAAQKGFTNVAVVFQNDVGDLGNEPGLMPALSKEHVHVSTNTTIAGDAASYETAVYRMIKGKPQALLLSADTQTITTLLSEYKQLNNGNVPPVITRTEVMAPDFYKAVQQVMGTTYLTQDVYFVGSYMDMSTRTYAAYKKSLLNTRQVQLPAVVATVGPIASLYDGINVLALAMTAAHSTQGSVYNKYIPDVTTARPGAVVVHNYAQGVAELRAGHQIQYVGVVGVVAFNKYHDSPGAFGVFTFSKTENPLLHGMVSPAAVAKALE